MDNKGGQAVSDTVTLRVTQPTRPETYCTTSDMIVVREDGTFVVIPKGTLFVAPVPEGPLKIEQVSP